MAKVKKVKEFIQTSGVIGVDESYEETGLSLSIDGTVITALSVKEKGHWEMRKKVREEIVHLHELFTAKTRKADNCCIVFERIRQFSHCFISMPYIVGMSYLNAYVLDAGYFLGLKAYSIDTRAWKSAVLGSSKKVQNKYGVAEEKFLALNYCMQNGLKQFVAEEVTNNKRPPKGAFEKEGKLWHFNDNIADAICISLSPWFASPEAFKLEL